MAAQTREAIGSEAIAKRALSLLRALDQQSKGTAISPVRLHRLRTDLRRLQAWLDLVGQHASATVLATQITRLSPLRALQVFDQWLVRHQARRSDLLKIRRLSKRAADEIRLKKCYSAIEETIEKVTDWTPSLERMFNRTNWRRHQTASTRLLAAAREKPKRKRLHALRLHIKQLRYQIEWTPHPALHRVFLTQLRQAHRRLGIYEERAAFRKLAKQLKLKSRPHIVRSWRRARKRAHSLLQGMDWLLDSLDRLGNRLTGV